MSRLNLNLPDDIAAVLAQESSKAGCTPEEMAVDLLKRALAFRRFRSVRKSLLEALGDDAPESDDDIFRRVS
jgi:hypothetical protein